MLRNFISTVLIIVLLISGSGISYLFSTHLARVHARKYDSELLAESMSGEFITLNSIAYKKLPKEKISDQIFEITWNGNKYDIYKTEINADQTITLFARHDEREQLAIKQLKEAHLPGRRNTTQFAPFYLFHFFQAPEIINNSEPSFLLDDLKAVNYILANFYSANYPPPKNDIA